MGHGGFGVQGGWHGWIDFALIVRGWASEMRGFFAALRMTTRRVSQVEG